MGNSSVRGNRTAHRINTQFGWKQRTVVAALSLFILLHVWISRPVGSKHPPSSSQQLPDCLRPNRTKTEALVSTLEQRVNDWKAINLGLPKMGSTSLYHFYQCADIPANHWRVEKNQFIGACLQHASSVDDCTYGAQALTQIDVAIAPELCIFPQLTLLEPLLLHQPQTLYILMFRDIYDWTNSLQSQVRSDGTSLWDRMGDCTDLHTIGAAELVCHQVETIRRLQPDHVLELDLMDSVWTGQVLSRLYGVSTTCWKQTNQRKHSRIPWWLGG